MEKHEFVTTLYCLQKTLEECMEDFENDNEVRGLFHLGALEAEIKHCLKRFEFDDGSDDETPLDQVY